MKKIKKNNLLDEMQEQKLLNIEHNGCWFAFWGLLVVILLQTFIYRDNSFEHIVGELIVFLCLCLYILAACMRNGIWDRKYKANLKTNLVLSILASLVMGILFFANSYFTYDKFLGSIATGIFMFIETFILCIAALTIASSIYKKRLQKLERDVEERGSNK